MRPWRVDIAESCEQFAGKPPGRMFSNEINIFVELRVLEGDLANGFTKL
jgi:hypothetical protein